MFAVTTPDRNDELLTTLYRLADSSAIKWNIWRYVVRHAWNEIESEWVVDVLNERQNGNEKEEA